LRRRVWKREALRVSGGLSQVGPRLPAPQLAEIIFHFPRPSRVCAAVGVVDGATPQKLEIGLHCATDEGGAAFFLGEGLPIHLFE
jgi:hypothetical protein